METTHLHEYVTIADKRSFTAAAQELHVTQSTLSKHVASLEREFGVDLFTRDKEGVKLTDAGRALYAHALGIMAQLQRTCHALRVLGAPGASAAGQAGVTHGAGDALSRACEAAGATALLTPDEQQAFGLFMQGVGFDAIQDALLLSRDGVADLLASAYGKLGVHTKREAQELLRTLRVGGEPTTRPC